jgi:hypothetical protein
MRGKVEETVSKFVHELRERHPNVIVELLDWQSPHVDAWVRIKCPSLEEIDDVIETEAHLATKYYLDEGVYIQVTASRLDPVPSEIER